VNDAAFSGLLFFTYRAAALSLQGPRPGLTQSVSLLPSWSLKPKGILPLFRRPSLPEPAAGVLFGAAVPLPKADLTRRFPWFNF